MPPVRGLDSAAGVSVAAEPRSAVDAQIEPVWSARDTTTAIFCREPTRASHALPFSHAGAYLSRSVA